MSAHKLPGEQQDNISRATLDHAGRDEPVIELMPDEEADLIEAQAEMKRGEFATDAEVEAVFSKFHI